jgi:hypothetical protein
VSIGAAAMLATLGLLREIAEELRSTGTWSAIERSFFANPNTSESTLSGTAF